MKRIVILGVLLASVLFAGVAVAQEQPYGDKNNTTGREHWTDGHDEVTLENVTHYVSRVGTFVVGNDPTDPGIGPIFVGLIVGAMSIQLIGQSRPGLVASGTMAVLTVAALSAPAGTALLPRWLYGTAVLLMALIAGVIYIRMMR